MKKAVGVVSTAALCSMMLVPAFASTTVGTAMTVSGNSPYASSTIGGPGTNTVNAEVEPWIDVNPTNTQNMVASWQQDRWSNGGAHGLVAGYTTNGGQTWSESTLPFSSSAPGGINFERASDAWHSFGPDGKLYAVSISFNQSNNDNCVAAATSSDGGKTWGNVNIIKQDIGTYQYFSDKESVTADPTKPGTAYVVWDRLVSPNANPYAVANAWAYTGPTWFSKTTDGGKTWSTPQIIVDTAQNNQTIGNYIVVDPRNGTLYNFFSWWVSTGTNSNQTHGDNIAFTKSTDGGTTWTQPQVIASVNSVSVTDPNTGDSIRTGDDLPEPTIDPVTGKLYVAWQDGRFSNGAHADIALSTSSDGGATWTAPSQVNTPTGQSAFTPQIRVNSNGVVGVQYYDFRNVGSNTSTLPTDAWFTSSNDGGLTWGNEAHVRGSFDMLTAPYAEGYFIGDYEGMTTVGANFYSCYVATTGNSADPTDVFVNKITP